MLAKNADPEPITRTERVRRSYLLNRCHVSDKTTITTAKGNATTVTWMISGWSGRPSKRTKPSVIEITIPFFELEMQKPVAPR
jgi:hypothetical protein